MSARISSWREATLNKMRLPAVLGELVLLAILLSLAFLLYFFPHLYTADLAPVPDSMEYTLSALSVAKGSGYFIHINRIAFPPRYSFGYPLLLVPIYWFIGHDPTLAIYASLFFGLMSIFLVYLIGRTVFKPVVGLLAAAWLIFSPQHIDLSYAIMSDGASLALFLLAIYLTLKARKNVSFVCLGVILGYLFLIRSINIVLLPAFYFILNQKSMKTYLLILLGLLPLGISFPIYNWVTFGSPFTTGYAYWVPYWYGSATATFNWSYLWHNGNTDKGNLVQYFRLMTGLDSTLYPFSIFALGCLGILEQRKQKLARFCISVTSLLLISYVFYFYYSPRFIIQAAALWLILAAYGCYAIAQWVSRIVGLHGAPIFAIFLILTGIASAPWPRKDAVNKSYLWRTEVNHIDWPIPAKYKIAQAINNNLENNAYILTRIEGPYIDQYVLRDTERVYIPISRSRVPYYEKGLSQTKDWPVAVEQLDMLQAIVKRGVPVYLDETSCPRIRVYDGDFSLTKENVDECAPLRKAFQMEIAFEIMPGWHLYRLRPLSR